MVPQKKLYDAFVQEEGVDGYRLNQTMKTYDQISQLGVKVAKGQSLINEGYFMWEASLLECRISCWVLVFI